MNVFSLDSLTPTEEKWKITTTPGIQCSSTRMSISALVAPSGYALHSLPNHFLLGGVARHHFSVPIMWDNATAFRVTLPSFGNSLGGVLRGGQGSIKKESQVWQHMNAFNFVTINISFWACRRPSPFCYSTHGVDLILSLLV